MEYKRLTMEKEYGCCLCHDRKCKKPNLYCKDRLECEIYNRLADNIQQEIYECYVTEFIYNNKGLDICLSKKCLNGYAYFTLKDIGKTVFLTREEAEKKLKELQNG